MNYQKLLGRSGEMAVARYLEKEGFEVCSLNYSCRSGEIDVIAEKPELRIFVEVKTRQNHYFDISQVVNLTKQRRIISTAYYYNAHFGGLNDRTHRFDVAILQPDGEGWLIRYIPNAFTPSVEWF